MKAIGLCDELTKVEFPDIVPRSSQFVASKLFSCIGAQFLWNHNILRMRRETLVTPIVDHPPEAGDGQRVCGVNVPLLTLV